MRHTPARLNRAWLAVVGLVLLVLGVLALGLATGWWSSLLSGGAAEGLPGRDAPLAPDTSVFQAAWVAPVVALVGVVLALAALGWLLAQIPRRHEAKDLRLHTSSLTGLTTCEPSVLTDAVAEQATSIAGVGSADAVLRGSARTPDLTLRLVVDDRAELREVLRQADTVAAASAVTALDVRLARLGILVEVQRTRRSHDRITV